MGGAGLPRGLATHYVAALDAAEFAEIEREWLAGNVAIDFQLGHARFHALGAVDAVHYFIFAPGLVYVWNFAEADRFIEGDGFVEVGNHAAIEFNADDGAFVRPELRSGVRRLSKSGDRDAQNQRASDGGRS